MASTGTSKNETGKKQTGKSSSAAAGRTGSRAGRRNARQDAKPLDALKLLKADHREVETWFEEFEKSDDENEKQELAAQICTALSVHAQIEEEIFYPAARDAIEDDDLLDEAEVEHASAKQLIAEIASMRVGEPLFDAKVKVLGEYVKHHVKEEENELFAECRDSDMDLKALGEEMAARKAELMAQ